MVRYSFLVRLSHPLLHTGLSRRILDHLIRPRQNIGRNRESDLLRGFEIDHKLELRRLLDGQIGRLGSFQDLVYVIGYALVTLCDIRTVENEPTDIYSL